LATLTGRTNFWALVLNTPRNRFQEIFGFGLSNASVNGLPIDSNWLASYMQEGLFGVVVCALSLVFLFVTLSAAAQHTRTRPVHRDVLRAGVNSDRLSAPSTPLDPAWPRRSS
jgi:hypothetical protein